MKSVYTITDVENGQSVKVGQSSESQIYNRSSN
jgi:hypothetical protein